MIMPHYHPLSILYSSYYPIVSMGQGASAYMLFQFSSNGRVQQSLDALIDGISEVRQLLGWKHMGFTRKNERNLWISPSSLSENGYTIFDIWIGDLTLVRFQHFWGFHPKKSHFSMNRRSLDPENPEKSHFPKRRRCDAEAVWLAHHDVRPAEARPVNGWCILVCRCLLVYNDWFRF